MRSRVPVTFLVSALALSTQAAPLSAQTPPAVAALLARAEARLTRGQTRGAIALFRRASDRAPTDPRAPLRLASLLLPATAPNPAVPPAVRERAIEVRDRLAAPLAQAASTVDHRSLVMAHAWARALTGEAREAIVGIGSVALVLDPEAAAMLEQVATLAVHEGALAVADEALVNARQIDAARADLVRSHAAVKLARGQTGPAIELLRGLVDRDPLARAPRRDLAMAYLAAGYPARAVGILEPLVTDCPEPVDCQLDLARAALEAGELDRARAAAQRALEVADPHAAEPALLLGEVELRRAEPDRARAAFREALRRNPSNNRAVQALRSLDAPTGAAR